MALSGSLTTNAYEGVRSLTLTWSATQSVGNNTSTINWTLSGSGSTANYNPYYASGPFRIVIDGAQVYYSTARIQLRSGTVVASGSHTVTHSGDGTKSFSIRVEGAIYATSYNCTAEQSFQLNQILRKSVITSAPDFTDEDTPSIGFTLPISDSSVSHDIYVLKPGESVAVISKKVTSQPFAINFTEAERNILRGLNTTSNITLIDLMLRTYYNGASVGEDRIQRCLTIANPNPTLNPTVVDGNSETIALTGDRNKLIKYHSSAQVSFGAAGVKQATIVGWLARCGSQSIGCDGPIHGVESGTFSLSVEDSRGNITSTTVTKPLVEYRKLTCNITKITGTVSGNFTVVAKGDYFNGSFGAVSNDLTVHCFYKNLRTNQLGDEVMEIVKSGNGYTATAVFSEFSPEDTYEFQIAATDKLERVTTPVENAKCLPIFDVGDGSFNVNGIFSVNGISLLDLIYPVGSIYMTLASGAGPDPGDLFGGTWKRLENRFLVGTGNQYVVGQTGGSNTHDHTMKYMFSSTYVAGSGVAYTDGGTVPNTTQYTGASDSRPPYLAVHMWQRTA